MTLNQLVSVLPAWQDSLVFILLSDVEKCQVFTPASQNWTVFKHRRTENLFFQLRKVIWPWWMKTFTEIIMNNYSSKPLLATFRSSFHQTTKPRLAPTVWTLSSWCFGEKEAPAASAGHIILINASVFVFLATGTREAEPAGSSFCVSPQLRSAPLRVLLPSSSKVSTARCIHVKLMHYILTVPAAVFHKSWHLWAGGSQWSDTFTETVRRKLFS